MVVKRILIPVAAMLAGSALMAGFYLGVLTWLEGWDYATWQIGRDRLYVGPLIIAFGLQAALYSILRFRLYAPVRSTAANGAMMGASGGTSATAMIACCLHHATDVLPVLGLSAATAFLVQYQRPLMQISLAMNVVGIVIMLRALHRARQGLRRVLEPA